MVLENQLDLKNYLKLLSKLPTWNPFAKTIVLYEKQKNESSENLAKLFINQLHAMKLLRVIVLLYSALDDEIISYSWNPYSETNCGGKCETVYILDRCKDNLISQIEVQKEMFPLDLRGCPLLTYVVISEPYVMPPVRKLTSELWNDAYEFQKGVEINLGVRQAAYERNFAVVSSRRQAMYKDHILGRGESLIYCFAESDNLYKYGVALLARNWYPLLDRFNNIIRSVSENGLIEKWSEELFNRPKGAERSSTIVPLGMQHLLGAFLLLGVLDLICIIVFIGELVYKLLRRTVGTESG
ncbi:uncharacterized protein LOC125054016 [Pieris napi]|uniref:uncharacterized protein LOC125054016 n=1 Tax=Pieris napi TaxID=78633 RepID=UPI001FB881DF|nr:uncharacterized protein LOC125054016 [Pieris napi]